MQLTVLYFLRNSTEKDVDIHHMGQDIYCGELKNNPLDTMSSMLSEFYMPLMQAKTDWGHCDKDNQSHLVHCMKTFVSVLNSNFSSKKHSVYSVSALCIHG